jgi:nitrogen fixation protein FixH
MNTTTTTPLKGKTIFLYFLAFFGFIAIVNAGMITLALRTHTGTVTDHPYEKGLAYNEVVNAEVAQEKLGWKGEIILRRFSEKENSFRLEFSLKDKNDNRITPTKVTARISRPTQAGMDFDVELDNSEAHISFPEKGSWEVRIFAEVVDKKYQQSKRIVVK